MSAAGLVPHEVVVEPLDPSSARRERHALQGLYLLAFSPPPYAETAREADAFGALVDRDSLRPGFDAFVARAADGRPVGLVYGYSTPVRLPSGAWWARLESAMGPAAVQTWVLGQFAFCWFAVEPSAQGTGVGAALYAALMARVRTPRSWLVTHGAGSRAREMYERRGWQELARAELGWLPGDRAVMGLDVARRRQ